MIFESVGLVSWLVVSLLAQEADFEWKKLVDLPDPIGVASPFAGTVGGTLLVAGGANFPNQTPWVGGKKQWHDHVWALDTLESTWRDIGKLPGKLAYGVSISADDGLVCIGGSDQDRHYHQVFLLQLRNGLLVTKFLPSLPHAIANACGGSIGKTIYVAGGTESPNATATLNTFLSLDLENLSRGWTELPTWPGPGRMLSVSAVVEDSFFLVSGTDLSSDENGKPVRRYLSDAYRFRSQSGWERIADIARPCVACPSPAPTLGAASFIILGGDDGSKVGFQPVEEHPGFVKSIQGFDTLQNKWLQLGYTPAPRVTAPVVKWDDRWLIISGEERPGVRSPQVWSFKSTLWK